MRGQPRGPGLFHVGTLTLSWGPKGSRNKDNQNDRWGQRWLSTPLALVHYFVSYASAAALALVS